MGKRDGAAFFPSAAADGTLLARGICRRVRPVRSAVEGICAHYKKTSVFCDSIYR